MEMTDDNLRDSRLRGIADEIKQEDMSIIKKPMISLNNDDDDDLKQTDYSKQIGTPFKQQKLSAWQPILTASTVLPWLLAIGIIFLPIGFLLLNTSNRIQEYRYDYTNCKARDKEISCAKLIGNRTLMNREDCLCDIDFEFKKTMDKDVYFYYALSNFYQNHRRYVRSRNDWQLLGYTNIDLTDCQPFDKAFDKKKNEKMSVAPCGAIANSLFNDTFKLFYELPTSNGPIEVKLLEDEIAWPTDRKNKFKNPSNLNDLDKFTHPVNWNVSLKEFRSGNSVAFENEHLIVWMRSAALPNFRKLYARVDHTAEQFKLGLPKGNYKLVINYKFPVTQFDGKKSFILSNTSWLGGKNPFLGYAYIITGCLCILITSLLFFIYRKYGVRERDMIRVDANTPFIYSNLQDN